MTGIIITGIPADDPVNRAHAARLGAADIPWPVPYKNSVLMDCYACGGRVHVGPELQKARTAAVNAGDDPPVLCLLRAGAQFAGGPGRERDAAEAWAFEMKVYFKRGVGEPPAVTYAGGVYTVIGLIQTTHPGDHPKADGIVWFT